MYYADICLMRHDPIHCPAVQARLVQRGLRGLRLHFTWMRPDWEMIRRMLRIGGPAGAEATLMWVAQIGFIKIVAHTASGDAATINFAAHMIAVRMTAITYLPAAAWMTAAATLVGQYLGAGQPRNSARAAHLAALQGGVLTEVLTETVGGGDEVTYWPGQVRMGAVWNRYGESSGTLGEDWPRTLEELEQLGAR